MQVPCLYLGYCSTWLSCFAAENSYSKHTSSSKLLFTKTDSAQSKKLKDLSITNFEWDFYSNHSWGCDGDFASLSAWTKKTLHQCCRLWRQPTKASSYVSFSDSYQANYCSPDYDSLKYRLRLSQFASWRQSFVGKRLNGLDAWVFRFVLSNHKFGP